MLVDDHANYRQVLGEALTEDGWDVIEAAPGENALMLDVKPAFLVTDINLGPGNGWVESWWACRWPDVGLRGRSRVREFLLFISGANQPDRRSIFYWEHFFRNPSFCPISSLRFPGWLARLLLEHRYASGGS
jgi:hypothetical protein